MTVKRRFIQCDVFTGTPTKGNALAVVLDGEGLSSQQMQDFARWTNLAETTFISHPDGADADYRVRIFTPGREMPFAGHPTLGSCMAWLHAGGKPADATKVRQQCAIGVVDIDLSRGMPAFAAPVTHVLKTDEAERMHIQAQLNIDPSSVLNFVKLDNGPTWKVFELASASEVLNVDSSKITWTDFGPIGLFGKANEGSAHDYEVRMLAPSSGMSEDPITGSLNAAIAIWLQSQDRLPEYLVVAQGRNIAREGRVVIQTEQDGSVWIGGEVHIVVEGEVHL